MNQLDPINALTALASAIFGAALAPFIGAYSLIVIAATVGASWSLRRQSKPQACATRSPAADALATISYFLLINFTAILVTVGAATMLAEWFKLSEPVWLFSPIALLIGGVGGDWPRVLKWLFLRALRVFERRAGVKND